MALEILQGFTPKCLTMVALWFFRFCGKRPEIAVNTPVVLALLYHTKYKHTEKDGTNKEQQQDETQDEDSSPTIDNQTTDDTTEKGDEGIEKPEDNHSPKEIEEFKLQVYTPQQAGLDFVKELTDRLKEEEKNKKLIFTDVNSVDKITQDQPLLVICMNNSRLGSDAKQCVKGIKGFSDSKSSVLLVFHHKEKHALPSEKSARVLVHSEFDTVCRIFDVACHVGSGVYPCEMNTIMYSEILKFIRSQFNTTAQ